MAIGYLWMVTGYLWMLINATWAKADSIISQTEYGYPPRFLLFTIQDLFRLFTKGSKEIQFDLILFQVFAQEYYLANSVCSFGLYISWEMFLPVIENKGHNCKIYLWLVAGFMVGRNQEGTYTCYQAVAHVTHTWLVLI